MHKPQLVFVNYLSRSGSTYLCTLLDRYENIAVGIEAGFPGFDTHLMPLATPTLANEGQLDNYLNLLSTDIRFSQWKLNIAALKDVIAQQGYPIRFRAILSACLDQYFSSDTLIRVHKACYYLECIEEARKEFPLARHICMQRDPRGIFASQKNAISLYTNAPMAASILAFIRRYKERTALLDHHAPEDDVLVLRYEDLIENLEGSLNNILEFIGLEDRTESLDPNYQNKIPQNQQTLHSNISKQPQVSGVNKWTKSLSNVEVRLIQDILRKEMRAYNYAMTLVALTWPESMNYVYLRFRFLLSLTKRNALKIISNWAPQQQEKLF